MKWVAMTVLLASAPASAETLVDAIIRHDAADISRLRATLPDDSARCALGVAYIFRDDLTRAALYLEGCATARIARGVAGWVRLAVKALDDRLRMSELAPLLVTTYPAGLLVAIDTVPDEVFPTPATLWLPAGTHAIRAGKASIEVTLGARSRSTAHVVSVESPRLDPRVAVMRENDCVLHRKQHPSRSCDELLRNDDDFDMPALPTWLHLQHHDSLAMILWTAEEL